MKPNRNRFRAWDGLAMHSDFYLDNNSGIPVVWRDGFICPRPSWILMQSTGMVDKKEKEIFEGDIVKHVYIRSETGFGVGLIGWDDLYAAFSLQQSKCFYGSSPLCRLDTFKDLEVIGNIYENPELCSEIKHS